MNGGYFVPVWAFGWWPWPWDATAANMQLTWTQPGRKFQDGVDTDKRAEISFATILGVCSSAFTANVTAVFESFGESVRSSGFHRV